MLKVGDLVKNYAPPSAAEAKHKRKLKHLFQWKGLMQIISIEGLMMDLVSVTNSDKHYS